MYKIIWWRNMKRNDHLENRSMNVSVIIILTVKKVGGDRIGLIWLREANCRNS
jgi:hypothetical protein